MATGPDERPSSTGLHFARGRGAQVNPGNRFEDLHLHVLGEHLDEVIAENPDGTQVRTRIYPDKTKSIINHVDSPDLSFSWTINPYRGCEHGCVYCYARPGHEYLGLSCGLDFETKILAKLDAPTLLRDELSHPRWIGETIVMSGVTDPYQPIEDKLRITRRCLEVMAEFGQPVGIITKSRLILRDLDLLSDLARDTAARAAISLTTLDPKLAAKMEPRASTPRDRLRAIESLANAGVPVVVMTAPVIPGLNDHEVPQLLKAAADAGARSAGYVLLKLPFEVKSVFIEWVQREFPDRAPKVLSQLTQARGGKLYNSTFFERQRGTGPRAAQIRDAFDMFRRRYGLDQDIAPMSRARFDRAKAARERAARGPTLFEP